jgi:hypothetical protein
MRCPVGHHWALVRWVDKSTLTDAERESLRLREGLDDQDDAKLATGIGLAFGVIGLVIALIVQTWWAFAYVVVVIVCGAFFIRARRRETES